jgi:PAS domain S-box-containing protein
MIARHQYDPLRFLSEGGMMGAFMRAYDWSTTSLGPHQEWPRALLTLVRVMLNSRQPMFIAWGADRTLIYNDTYAPMLGERHPAALGRPFFETWPEVRDEVGSLMDRVFAGEPVHMDDLQLILHRNGYPEEAHFAFSYTPVPGDDGTIVGLFCACTETTNRVTDERRQVADAKRERDRLFEMSRDLFGVATFDGYLTSINPAWSRQLGRSDDELLSRPFAEIIHPDDLAVTGNVVAALRSGQPVHQFHVRLLTADGTPLSFAWSAVPGADTASGSFYTVGRDITAEKQAAETLARTEEALRQSQKMEAVGQLTGGLAHDFNNLLAGISGSLELMQTRMQQGRLTDVDRYMTAAQGAAKRAAALTHRLLAFSRRQTLDPKPTDVNRLVSGMQELIQRTVGPAISVEAVGASGVWPALVDAPQLENALLNLCINARDAMPEGGRITIETANKWLDERAARQHDMPEGQYLALSVTDTGTGMPPEVIARVFEPFFTTKPLGEGTGLGLSMIYGFAKQSGGHVRIYSEVGKGTTVSIYLPRYYGDIDEEDGHATVSALPRSEQGETVLVVDDEPTVRMLVTDILEDLGYTAIEASDSVAGLKVLQSDVRIDLLVSDVGLPGGMNGRQMADAARVLRPGLKVLFITGYAENSILGNGLLAPGMAVLTKPFAIETMAARIRSMIEASRVSPPIHN